MKITIEETSKDGKKQSTVTEIKDIDASQDSIKRKPCPGPIARPCPKLMDVLGIVFGSGWCRNGRAK